MPVYDFKNIETGEIEEFTMSYTKLDEFKKDNPHLTQYIGSAPALSSKGAQGALQRAGNGWKEVQDKVRSGLPPSLRDNIKTK